jgi:hypothetical protein
LGLVHRAFTDELRAGEHEQRKTSVTALQDWLSIRPSNPRNRLKSFICALRGIGSDEAADAPAEPVLIERGVERC